MTQEIRKISNFVPKYDQRILSPHKTWKKYNEHEAFYKKTLF